MLEIASASTGSTDTGAKRIDYARLGIPEYWRFDETGRYHGARLAGDRLVDGVYVPIQIDRLAHDVLQGRSLAVNLDLRWERGDLAWIDPATGRHIVTFDDERAARVAAESALNAERQARVAERAARVAAEARIRELEARVQQRNDHP